MNFSINNGYENKLGTAHVDCSKYDIPAADDNYTTYPAFWLHDKDEIFIKDVGFADLDY